ncbi:MAG TPA: carboxypeptidase-like regulatory domain-containing protein, partial [Terriglobales bacterium]
MLHKLGYLMLALGLVMPAAATSKPGSISGCVRDSAGVPQMGAAVEILGSASRAMKVFTDDRGFYTIAGLVPGVYNLRVSAPSFLPALRERIGLRPGGSMVVNVTLSTIFEAFQLSPHRGITEEDDWKWTLRSAANRPVLRYDDEGPVVVAEGDGHTLKGRLSFVAGSDSGGYGGASDVSTGFSLEHSLFSSGTLALNGNLGYGDGAPTAVVRTSYSHTLPNGSHPEIALTVRRFASPDQNLHSLQALALSVSDGFTMGDWLDVDFGSELQTIQFMGRV